jgi:hypothetical protein
MRRLFPCATACTLLMVASCDRRGTAVRDSGPDADSDSDSDTDGPILGLHGLDLLLVVDNSISMGEEQGALETSMFSLVNALMDPVSGVGVGDVRIGVVTTDMGLSWGGHPYEEGDGWPGELPSTCTAAGDDGAFQSYAAGQTVAIEDGIIPCEDDDHCPPGWSCDSFCEAPGGETELTCPELEGAWISKYPASPDDDFALEAACLTQQGTMGCGWKQPLASASRTLHRADKEFFLRHDALLAIVQEGMQLTELDEGVGPHLLPACERWEGYYQLTKAMPARRMVELAIELGEHGYVSSICDADWSGAMTDIGKATAKMIDDYWDSWFGETLAGGPS